MTSLAVGLWAGSLCLAQSNEKPLSAADQKFFTKLATRIEPSLKGKSTRLDQYVHFYEKELANDARLFAFEVDAEPGERKQSVILKGYVEFQEHRQAIGRMLQTLGFDVTNIIEVLPHAELGEKRFAIVKAAHSLSFDKPMGDQDVVTECLIGEPLFLLKRVGKFYLAHASEGYLGYVAAHDVLTMNESEFKNYLKGPRCHLLERQKFGDTVFPAGARLKTISDQDGSVKIQTPDGGFVTLPATACKTRDTAKDIENVVNTGMRLLGTKYLWGGKTSAGVDCSGLVQIAYGASGFHLPRDSNQQIYLGRLTATRWCPSTMQRGDTMYFLGSRGRIRHTAIYLGDNQYLQAESPVACITSLNPDDENYDARRHATFAFAKRLID